MTTAQNSSRQQAAADLAAALLPRLSAQGRDWLAEATRAVAEDPAAVHRLFPVAGRAVGRRGLTHDPPGGWAWRTDEAARAQLLAAVPDGRRDHVLRELYRHGDRDERSAVLRALDVLPRGPVTRELVLDALRTNDPRLVAGALSPTGLGVLDGQELVQAVLKCVFMDLDLTDLALPDLLVTPALCRALVGYALERETAGRTVSPALWPLVERHPPHDLLAALAQLRADDDTAGEPR